MACGGIQKFHVASSMVVSRQCEGACLYSKWRQMVPRPTWCASIPGSSSTPSISSLTPSAARAQWPQVRSQVVVDALGKHALPRCKCARESIRQDVEAEAAQAVVDDFAKHLAA